VFLKEPCTAGLPFALQASRINRAVRLWHRMRHLMFFAPMRYFDTFSTCQSSDVVKSFCFLHHDYVVHL
jgi:hypothetical protein